MTRTTSPAVGRAAATGRPWWRGTAGDPLLPAGLRRPAMVVAVLAAVVTAVLGWWFAGDTRAGRVDRTLSPLVSAHSSTGKAVEHVLTTLGEPVPVAVALAVLALLAYRVRGPRGVALVLTGPPLAMVTTSLLLKPVIDRTYDGGLAFPSGHTTAVGSLAVAVAVLVAGWAALPVAVRLLAVVPLVGLVAAVAASLVGRHYHYPTDTVGGAGVAVAVVLAMALAVDPVLDLRAARARRPRPRPTVDLDSSTVVLPRGHR